MTETLQTAEEYIATLRDRIDEKDQEIIRAILERRALSKVIQNTKEQNGLTRVDLNREVEILFAYTELLPSFGKDVGHQILNVCKS